MARTPSSMVALGSAAPDFALRDVVTGKTVSRAGVAGPKGMLAMFICRHCPFVKHVQDEIAATVVDKLRITLLGTVPTVRPVDPKAYPLILQAKALANQSSAKSLEQAIALYQQALAIAESMLEEVELMPFTYCDPDDANATTATAPALGAGGCATMVENLGVENDVSRYDPAFPYDNVSDYNNFSMAAGSLLDITGAAVGPAGYGVTVAVANNGMPAAGASPAIVPAEALLITVTVTGPDLVPVVLEGIRTRYSPKAVP